MKNSQYTNQINVSIGEMVRLSFNEVLPPPNEEVIQIIVLSMNIEFLKVLHDVIGRTLNDYADNIKNIQSNKDVN